jgi:hypothetical protein
MNAVRYYSLCNLQKRLFFFFLVALEFELRARQALLPLEPLHQPFSEIESLKLFAQGWL